MADPWLTIIGMNEDGPPGLSDASRAALADAALIFGGPRHLTLSGAGSRGRPWPVPFSVDPVLECRGQPVVILASGDPFWHGAGAVVASHLARDEWISHPAPSTFQLAANALGWRMEGVTCLGLHAAPLSRLRPHLHRNARLIVTLRDAAAAAELAGWLVASGWGASDLWVMEALGGPRERLRATAAHAFDLTDITAPVTIAIDAKGGDSLPRAPGLSDDLFQSDGQITKSPIRAITLATLAPRQGELLWDLGAGSGSISIEWCLAGGHALAVERRADRALNIRANALSFGVDHRLRVIDGAALDALADLHDAPDAVFIGGGCDPALLTALWQRLPPGTRLVVNSVTLDTDALLTGWHGQQGGDLTRIDIAKATPLGGMRGWTAARTVTQWSVVR